MNAPPALGMACLIVAIILFALSAIPFPAPYQPRLLAAGLAFFAAAHLVSP